MVRTTPALFGTLVLTLIGFGVLADRALVGQARAAREVAVARASETADLTALSVRAALARVEQAVGSAESRGGVKWERLAIPPPPSLPVLPFVPFARRPRAELSRLLASDGVTPSGLPEAVVARLALGDGAAVSGPGQPSTVEERLLEGRLPVRPEDLPALARRLGLGGDPRVSSLRDRLQRMPPSEGIPELPAFRRRRVGSNVEGWSRRWGDALHYEVAIRQLLVDANAAERARPAIEPPGTESPDGDAPRRLTVVPDVEGLSLVVTPEVPGVLRLAALRVVLLICVVAGCAGLVATRRALVKESRAMARERAFLANVSHELRTPLTAIRLFGETLAEGRGDPRDYGALIAQESERLSDLVERVLATTRVDESPAFARVNPGALARSAVDLMTARAERRGARLGYREDDDLPEARWDVDAVRRALLNLIDNAVKHGKAGGEVEVHACQAGDQIRLSVADDGPGIPAARSKTIFGRLVRGPGDAPGAGLGLYLAEQVARAHGGRVELITEEAVGSTFTLVLPVAPPGAGATP